MDEDGQFTFTKPEPQETPQGEEGAPEETNPMAGSSVDQRELAEAQMAMLEGGGSTPQENPPATRNKARNEVGPDKRMTGLPASAGNQNVDRRSERRIP